MIKIEYCPEAFTLRATGHAEYAPYGRDIVCAAVSTLIQTLALCVLGYTHGLESEPTVTVGDVTTISCSPLPERKRELSLIYWYCICGVDSLAELYPENIGITVLRQEDLHTES